MKKTKTPYVVKIRTIHRSSDFMEAYWEEWKPPSSKINAEFIKRRDERDKDSKRINRELTRESFIKHCIGFGWTDRLSKHRVVKVMYLYGYKLRVTFDNHEEMSLDFERLVFSPKYEIFEPLQDIEAFKKVTVDHDELYWDEFVLDIKADDLYNWQNVLY
jgi:hypothetical protein